MLLVYFFIYFLLWAKLSQYLLDRFSRFFFTKWKVFAWIFSIRSSFSDCTRDIAMATNFVAKLWQNYLPPALIALSFNNWMGYRYLNVRINSANDASILCENFVKFGQITPELTELICERQVRHGQKNGAFSRIFQDTLDRFSQSFYHIKVLYVQMMDLHLIFQFFKGRCYGNQIMFR